MLNKHARSVPCFIVNKLLGKYLGQVVSADPSHSKEIQWGALSKHSQIMNIALPLSLERTMHNRCMLPRMANGVETWPFT